MKNIFILLFLFYSQCYSDENIRTTSQLKIIHENETHQVCKNRIIDSQVVRNILSIDLFNSDTTTIKKLYKVEPKISITRVKNFEIDYTYFFYLFETPNTSLKLFRNDEGFYIENARIKGDEISLYKDCSIGMLKTDFCRNLDISETICDTLIVSDEDQTLNLTFIFVDELLKILEINSSDPTDNY